MYAVSIPGKIYHLLYPSSDFTLCGFKARRQSVTISSRRALLHIVPVSPPNRFLCKQCEKMRHRRNAEGARQVGEIPDGKSPRAKPRS